MPEDARRERERHRDSSHHFVAVGTGSVTDDSWRKIYIPRTKERKPQIQGANALTKASSGNSGRVVPSGGKV